MSEKLFLTPEGAAKLRGRIGGAARPAPNAMAERLRHAVRQGDLRENADYIMAKEEQAFLEGRILELETILRQAVIVEGHGPAGVGRHRLTVVVVRGRADRETFVLVGLKEAEPREGRISNESPIGRPCWASGSATRPWPERPAAS